MALSTALFGLYFKMVLPNQNNSSNPHVWFTLHSASPGTESSTAWLAVVSLGLFVAGKWSGLLRSHYRKVKLSDEYGNFIPFCHIIEEGNELCF